MGKVGSSSIENSIDDALHFHTLFRNPPCPPRFRRRRLGIKWLLGYIKDVVTLLFIKTRRKVKIITLIRNPVERNISMLFQDFPYWYMEYMEQDGKSARSNDAGNVRDVYVSSFPHDYPAKWFDLEIKKLTGIDVFSLPFDRDKGWAKYKSGRYEVFLLEMQKIDECWHEMECFVGRELRRQRVNSGDKKWYAPIYQVAKPQLMAEEDVNSRIFASTFYKKFYSKVR
jgi:hypothetical protein